MRLAPAEFFGSAWTLADCPRWDRVEIAMVGRSNVGKSSLLNALTGCKNLARISKTPGRTRCVNFFTVGDDLALVDLPGYGYAKIPRTEATKLARLLQDYLPNRPNLRALVLLVGARRGPEKDDLAVAHLVESAPSRAAAGRELILVATKSDKLKRSERGASLKRFDAVGATPLMCSAVTGEGIDELRRRILSLVSARRNQAGVGG